MAQNGTSHLLEKVQGLLDARCDQTHKSFKLRAVSEVLDGDWTYVVVQPNAVGVHSEDYIEIARWVEQELGRLFPNEQVILVPAKPQD